LKKTVQAVIVGIVLVIVGAVGVGISTSVGYYILQSLNNTGFTIPSSANYLSPIVSLLSSVILLLRIVSILAGTIMIIEALLKVFSGIGT